MIGTLTGIGIAAIVTVLVLSVVAGKLGSAPPKGDDHER